MGRMSGINPPDETPNEIRASEIPQVESFRSADTVVDVVAIIRAIRDHMYLTRKRPSFFGTRRSPPDRRGNEESSNRSLEVADPIGGTYTETAVSQCRSSQLVVL